MRVEKLIDYVVQAAIVVSSVFLLACGGGGGGEDGSNRGSTPPPELSLNQAGYNSSVVAYQYGHRSIPNIMITGAPSDLDWSRWAMLHDGSTYRLYFFKAGTNDTLYQFGYNPASSDYEYGYNSINVLKITGAPADADPSSFAMLHDGTDYRLYMRSVSNPARIYQFAFNSTSRNYEFGYRSIPVMDVTGAPSDVDWDRWAMLHDGSVYRHYAFKQGSETTFYQFGFNASTSDYEYGFRSIPTLTVQNMPSNSDTNDFAMLHDGSVYRFYFLKY